MKMFDFEDGLDYHSAIVACCCCIISDDTDDFYFAYCEVLNAEDFFLKYMTKNS